MRVAVTGATGFLGPHVVAAVRRRGHGVTAFARPATPSLPEAWAHDAGVGVVRHDLRERVGLTDALSGADAVVHLAAATQGGFHAQFAGTVIGTENLLLAMAEAGIRRMVLVSSLSVYDYSQLREGDLLDESAPVHRGAPDRDAYARTKALQEALVAGAVKELGLELTIVRPGLVYGAGHLWNPCLGIDFGRAFVRVGGSGRMPLTFVENCAEALAAAVDCPQAVGAVMNIVDDDLPSRREFTRALRSRDPSPPTVVPVSWRAMRGLASAASAVNNLVFGGAARLPSFLIPAHVVARFAPLRYSNEHAKQTLGWSPHCGFEEAIERALGNGGGAPAAEP